MKQIVMTTSHTRVPLHTKSATPFMFLERDLPICNNQIDLQWLQQIPFCINKQGALYIPRGYEHPKYVRSVNALIFQDFNYKDQRRQYAAPCNVWKRDMYVAPHPAGSAWNQYMFDRFLSGAR
jgi:hypothetical protein